MNDTLVCETNKTSKCANCPVRTACGLLTAVRIDDVIQAPCGQAIGYAPQSQFDGREFALHYWVADSSEWKKVEGSGKRPNGIAWVFIGEIHRSATGASE